MSSLSTTLRLLTPKFPRNPNPNPNPKPIHSFRKNRLISFNRHISPSYSQQQQQQSDEQTLNLLPQSLREIISLFQSVGENPKSKYQQLLHYGSQLPALNPKFKTDNHRVRGCVSQVWIRAFADPSDPSNVCFEADSDSALTKGLAAVLVFGLSGYPVDVIAGVPPEFVLMLGLRQSLTPSRNNGFLNMLGLMQKRAREIGCLGGDDVSSVGLDGSFVLKDEDVGIDDDSGVSDGYGDGDRSSLSAGSKRRIGVSSDGEDGSFVLKGKYLGDVLEELDNDIDEDSGVNNEYVESDRSSLSAESKKKNDGRLFLMDEDVDERGIGLEEKLEEGIDDDSLVVGGTRRERIKQVLERGLSPVELDVEDISHLHAGHAGVRGSMSGETHFNVRVVSEEFEGKSLVKRHRLVYDLLQDELRSGLHSLSIVAKTPNEIKGDI